MFHSYTLSLTRETPFFRGRTNAAHLYYEAGEGEEIHYVDFTSLYPYVNKYGTYPIGHPEILATKGLSTDINKYFGLIKCTVTAPKKLLHPVLPFRSGGKLLFPLCRTCIENKIQNSCNHTDSERELTGTWVTTEVKKATEVGYKITRVDVVWHFPEKSVYDPQNPSSGLFTEYINTFLKLKQEASGWPEWCATENDKEKYIEEYKQIEGIHLRKENIAHNPGLRSLAKLMLNSFWGKFGQKENLPKTIYTQEPNTVYDLLSDPTVLVNDINFVNDHLAEVKYESDEQSIQVNRKVNVVIAAFTTASARLKLYELLEALQERVLYYDTDSVVYVSKNGEWQPPTGDYLGELTNEIDKKDGNYIKCFVSGGPKNYAYMLDSGKSVCKLVTPFTAVISGPTSSGKSVFVKKLLQNNYFDKKLDDITWCYGEYQPLFTELSNSATNINFVEGIPVETIDAFEASKNHLVIIDDLMTECSRDKRVVNLFTKGSHHRNISVIFIMQNFLLWIKRDSYNNS
ncbi:uncharacterized protein LOC117115269 [Anneissia japonica]|uniref:uncharacterized protein LOC117115269 n=1 Tax=Anneissia japonica TaxID=1529436 RepID=UPI001425ADAF|nr:uncharacterized protein LOC117115269 [Anneissia japonica]